MAGWRCSLISNISLRKWTFCNISQSSRILIKQKIYCRGKTRTRGVSRPSERPEKHTPAAFTAWAMHIHSAAAAFGQLIDLVLSIHYIDANFLFHRERSSAELYLRLGFHCCQKTQSRHPFLLLAGFPLDKSVNGMSTQVQGIFFSHGFII